MEKDALSRIPPILVWTVSGLLFFLAFLHPWVWWLFVPALVLFIRAAVVTRTVCRVITGSLLVGTLKAAGAIAWFWHVFPISWLELSPSVQLFAIGFYWMNVSFVIGIGMIVAGLAARYLASRGVAILLFPIALVCAEVAGSFLFSILSLGPGVSLNTSFSFGYVGYLASYAPGALGIAMWGGVYALSAYGAFAACAAYLLISFNSHRERRVALSVIAAVVVLAFISAIALVARSTPSEGKRIAVVETAVTAYQLTSTAGTALYDGIVRQAVSSALDTNPDLVVLPEGASFLRLFRSEEEAFERLARSGGPIVVGSGNVRREDGTTVLRAHVLDPARREVLYFDKQYLVPQGEHTIYYITWLLSLIGKDDLVAEAMRWELHPGEPHSYENVVSAIPSVLFCTESVNPLAVRSILSGRDTDLVVHLTSHSWFHQPFLLRPQLDRMLRIQAVWNGATIVEASNLSSSAMYRPDGTAVSGELTGSGARWKVYEYTR